MDTQKSLYRAAAQVRWEVERRFLPRSLVVTTEVVVMDQKPNPGNFIAELNQLVFDGREAPGGTGSKNTALSVYGEIQYRKISGPVDAEDGQQPEPLPEDPEGDETGKGPWVPSNATLEAIANYLESDETGKEPLTKTPAELEAEATETE